MFKKTRNDDQYIFSKNTCSKSTPSCLNESAFFSCIGVKYKNTSFCVSLFRQVYRVTIKKTTNVLLKTNQNILKKVNLPNSPKLNKKKRDLLLNRTESNGR